MEFWRAWCIPASGPEFPQAGVLDSFESLNGEVRLCIRVLNAEAPGEGETSREVEGES